MRYLIAVPKSRSKLLAGERINQLRMVGMRGDELSTVVKKRSAKYLIGYFELKIVNRRVFRLIQFLQEFASRLSLRSIIPCRAHQQLVHVQWTLHLPGPCYKKSRGF